MASDEKDLQKLVLVRLLRLNAKVEGFVTGVVAGLIVFVSTNWLILKGGNVVGPHLSLLGQYFAGYEVTFTGSLIGFAYAFVLGFLIGFGVTAMYNWIVDFRESRGQDYTL